LAISSKASIEIDARSSGDDEAPPRDHTADKHVICAN